MRIRKSGNASNIGKIEKMMRRKRLPTRIYDAIHPGDYTHHEDNVHAGIVIAVIMLAVVLVIANIVVYSNKVSEETAEELFLPSTYYTEAQRQDVVDMLYDYGFKNISVDSETGSIKARGTSDMVTQYENSFYDKNIKEDETELNDDYTPIGVNRIEISDDLSTLTIKTYADMSQSSSAIASIVDDSRISKIIRDYSIWYPMMNHGGSLTVRFVNIMDTTGGSDGTEYYSTTQSTANGIIAEIEAKSRSEANENSGNDSGNDGTDESSEPDENENSSSDESTMSSEESNEN